MNLTKMKAILDLLFIVHCSSCNNLNRQRFAVTVSLCVRSCEWIIAYNFETFYIPKTLFTQFRFQVHLYWYTTTIFELEKNTFIFVSQYWLNKI